MKTRVVHYAIAKSLCLLFLCLKLTKGWSLDAPEIQIVKKATEECFSSNSTYSCLVDRAAKAAERAVNVDVEIFDGVVLKRNQVVLGNSNQARSSQSFSERFSAIAENFIKSHTLNLDLSKMRKLTQQEDDLEDEEEDDLNYKYGGGGGGGGGGGKKGNEKQYFKYALMALLGIYGLSVPVILKTLAIIAGKALIASKIALIMLGSIALKKILHSDKQETPVKVHTHTIPIHEEEEYDRYMNANAYNFANIKGA